MNKGLALTDEVEIGGDVVIDNGDVEKETKADLVSRFLFAVLVPLGPFAVARARGNNKVVEELVVMEAGVKRNRTKNGADMGEAQLNAVMDIFRLDGSINRVVMVQVEASNLLRFKEFKPVALLGERAACILQPSDKFVGLGKVVANDGSLLKGLGESGFDQASGGKLGCHSTKAVSNGMT